MARSPEFNGRVAQLYFGGIVLRSGFGYLAVLGVLQGCGNTQTPAKDPAPQVLNLNQCLPVESKTIGIVGGKLLSETHQLAGSVANLVITLELKDNSKVVSQSFCTASFLDQNILLTAAHCVSVKSFAKEYKVSAAGVNRTVRVLTEAQPFCGFKQRLDSGTLQMAEAIEVRIKAEFDEAELEGLSFEEFIKRAGHDLALLRISSASNLPLRRPLSLAKTDRLRVASKHFLVGYGETLSYPQLGRASDDLMPALRFAPMELINEENFQDIETALLERNQVGALDFISQLQARQPSTQALLIGFTDPERRRGACAGDSGGPSVVLHRDTFLQTGVASSVESFGLNLDPCKVASLYVNLHAHEDWIKSNFRAMNRWGSVRAENLFK